MLQEHSYMTFVYGFGRSQKTESSHIAIEKMPYAILYIRRKTQKRRLEMGEDNRRSWYYF